MKESRGGRGSSGMTEDEVFSKVASLFKGQEDLLAEFGQFLPDAKRSLVSKNTRQGQNNLTNENKYFYPACPIGFLSHFHKVYIYNKYVIAICTVSLSTVYFTSFVCFLSYSLQEAH